jgi:hypothetical protein
MLYLKLELNAIPHQRTPLAIFSATPIEVKEKEGYQKSERESNSLAASTHCQDDKAFLYFNSRM